ncbi:MAG: hypothetical protein HZB36_04975 [Candidatus Omnitrophica bacterium]|nr:hypothetical protein [Candidatus Omnitrophota bacterium]
MRVRLPLPAPYLFWSSQLAYAIGLITTDGNLSPDKRHIQFISTDRQLARLFKSCLYLNNKISKTRASGYGKKPVYRISFGNVKFYRWLLSIGLKTNKSHSLGRMNIPKEYFADFLRGHLDGDGSVFTYTDRYMVYKEKRYTFKRLYTVFNSGSYKHLKWIQTRIKSHMDIKGSLTSYLPKNRLYPLWKLKYAKKNSNILLSWLYYKNNLPYLKRKRKIFENFIKTP